MKPSWGRFTVRGSAQVEAELTTLAGEVAETLSPLIPPTTLVALVLIGGYGRGEGGIERVGSTERPHNNLDFLLITRSPSPELQHRLDEALEPLRRRHGVGMDLSLTSPWKLRRSPPLLVWYDARHGHKTLLGDPDFLRGQHRFTVDRILPSDIRNLMVNRATLLLINRMILQQTPDSEAGRKSVVRHAVKCIIGYGDAMLFFRKAYHWSYQEKQRRMRERCDIPESFRQLYEEAMEFRFQPDYARYQSLSLSEWTNSLAELLGPMHLECERLRLGQPQLTWDHYLGSTLASALREQPLSVRGWARKLRNCLKGPHPPCPANLPASFALRCSGWNGVLPLLLPAVLYPVQAPPYQAQARQLLSEASGSNDELLGYLTLWGRYGDSNFHKALQALNLRLDVPTNPL